jgi:hypothetical protein
LAEEARRLAFLPSLPNHFLQIKFSSFLDIETLRRHQHSAVEKKRRQRFQETLLKLKEASGCFAKVFVAIGHWRD